MATTVEIVFIGLCSFLNIDGAQPDMPPPSVILHNDAVHHTPYVAFDTTVVRMTGATATSLGANFAMVKLEGEELIINDDASRGPTLDASMGKVVHLAKYSGISQPMWNRARIPLNGGLPEKGEVAAYLEFGSGTLSADRLSPIKWTFKDQTNNPSATQADDNFARSISYKFLSATDNLIIRARALDGGSHRKLVFTPVSGGAIKVFIGNSVKNKELKDIKFVEPAIHQAGVHFMEFYKSLDPIPRTMFIPFPIESNPNDIQGGPDTGYCGPDGQPNR